MWGKDLQGRIGADGMGEVKRGLRECNQNAFVHHLAEYIVLSHKF